MYLKYLFFALCGACMLSSCSNYQYVTVKSTLPRQPDKGFIVDSDSLQVSYRFGGAGQMQIDVLNKTSRPMYIDWSKSALIMNGKAHAYWRNEYSFNGRSRGHSISIYGNTTINGQRLKGLIGGSSALDIIPPRSTITKTPAKLFTKFIPQGDLRRAGARESDEGDLYAQYDSADSPIKFRSYLMISNTADLKYTSMLDHEFWVSGIIWSAKSLSRKKDDQVAIISLKKTNIHGTISIATIVTAVIFAIHSASN